jgi:hypothetical protein
MKLNIDISPRVEANLRDKASKNGVSPEEFARRLIEQGVESGSGIGAGKNGAHSSPETQRRLNAWREWFDSHPTLPVVADDSREQIYEGRGE